MSLSFPANIQAGPGHNWANAIAMATPIAHKGVIAGAKVQAMTVLDILMRPEITEQAWNYFKTVQTRNRTYTPLIRSGDKPAIWLNEETMAKSPAGDAQFLLRPDEVEKRISISSASNTLPCATLLPLRLRVVNERRSEPYWPIP